MSLHVSDADEELRIARNLFNDADMILDRAQKNQLQSLDEVRQKLEQGKTILDGMASGSSPRTMKPSTYVRLSPLQQKRVEGLLSEFQTLTRALAKCDAKRKDAQMMEANRMQVMGNGDALLRNQRNDLTAMERLAEEKRALLFAQNRLNGMNMESDAVMEALKGQRKRLTGTHGKLGDILESLGVSNTTVGQIIRTNKQDALLVAVGIFLMVLLMVYIWNRK